VKDTDTILDRLKKGDKKGLEMLFKNYYRPLVMYALGFLENRAEAEDAVQEVFIRFWENDHFSNIASYLHSYLYRSVKNACLNLMEKKVSVSSESLDTIREFSEEMPDDEAWTDYLDKIYLAINNLPPKTREIFLAIHVENKKYKDVATEFGVSVNTVKTALNRALKKLRENLGKIAFVICHPFWDFICR
jgi:RNA polymerase sigma-70 factor (ECF subfamily)